MSKLASKTGCNLAVFDYNILCYKLQNYRLQNILQSELVIYH